MKCETEETWLRLALGELTRNESDALERHTRECGTCRLKLTQQRQLLADLAHPHQSNLSTDAFVASVIDRCRQQPLSQAADSSLPKPEPRSWLKFWPYAALAASVAAGWVLVQSARLSPAPAGTWQARGGQAQNLDLNLEPFVIAETRPVPLAEATLGPSHGIVLRYTNPHAEPVYVMLFALDSAGEVHWIYPAYLDAAENPESVRLPPTREPQALQEIVEPVDVAPGKLEFFALVTASPLSVQEVEARLRRRRDVAAAFPDARVQAWSSTWRQP